MDTRRVYGAFNEAHKFPDVITIFAAFQFDPAAVDMINNLRSHDNKHEYLTVNMNTDLMTHDLRRKLHTDSLFWFVGQPDIALEKLESGKYRVKVLGFDYYDMASRQRL